MVKVHRGYELSILCDNGIRYLLRALAKVIKVSPEAMRGRFARMHWSHPDLLAPNRFKHRKKKAGRARQHRIEPDSFAKLGTNARRQNLARLGGVGSLERR